MKKLHLLFFAIVFSSAMAAQDLPPAPPKPQPEQKQQQKKESVWDRMSLGGYLGMQFGTVTNIDISPLLIYRVIPSLYTGLGMTYLYYKDKRYEPDYTSNGIGGSALVRYHVWKDLFAQVEYDPLYYTYYGEYDAFGNYVGLHKEAVWVHDLLLGAGYRQWMGERSFATISIFYNVNETYYSPYRNPIIRIGFGVGL
jgi:hypothetical protein